MSVSLYLGLPGDGKSMSGVRKVVSVLTQGTRYVITNLPLELGELQSYLQKEYGSDFDCLRRVVLLSEFQVRKFWLVRGDNWCLLDIGDDEWSKNRFPSLQRVYRWRRTDSVVERESLETLSESAVQALVEAGEVEQGDLGKLRLGAVYVIDECQNFWPARSYQTTPKGLPFYLTQHRHVGDDCVFITQKETQVEKVVRNLVAEFWVFKNIGMRRRLGFRLPGMFGYTCYTEPPSSVGAIYQSVGTFRMDTEGLAACYRTADGVGVGGPTMEADTKQKKQGLSWKWAIGVLLVLVVIAALMPGLLAKVLSKVLLGSSSQVGKALSPSPSTNVVSPTNVLAAHPYYGPSQVIVVSNIIVQRPIGFARSNDLRITGAMKSDNGWTIALEDGRILSRGDYWRVHESPGNSNRLSWVELEPQGQRARFFGTSPHAPAQRARAE